jgi:hypothetical protein
MVSRLDICRTYSPEALDDDADRSAALFQDRHHYEPSIHTCLVLVLHALELCFGHVRGPGV